MVSRGIDRRTIPFNCRLLMAEMALEIGLRIGGYRVCRRAEELRVAAVLTLAAPDQKLVN